MFNKQEELRILNTAKTKCMVPDELRGVRMSHSDDVVEVWHGMAEPAVGCGFHVSHYPTELFEAHRSLMSAS